MHAVANERRLVSTREAAEVLGVSTATIRRAARDGRLEPVRLRENGNLLFRVVDLDAIAPLPAREQAILDDLRVELDAREVEAQSRRPRTARTAAALAAPGSSQGTRSR